MLLAHAAAETVTQTGIGLGSAIAVVCSWERNRSILWSLIAGILSWVYVIYFALTRKPEETKTGRLQKQTSRVPKAGRGS